MNRKKYIDGIESFVEKYNSFIQVGILIGAMYVAIGKGILQKSETLEILLNINTIIVI